MALRWADNFEWWTTMPGTFTSNNGCSISGGKLLIGTSGNKAVAISLDSQGTWIVNFRVNLNTTENRTLIAFIDGATVQCSLAIKSTGKLAFYRGTNTAQIGSDSVSTLIFDTNTTYYDIEVKVTLGNTGSVEVRLNGSTTPEISASSVDITATANNTADRIGLGDYLNANATSQRYDQVIIMDGSGASNNDFIGVKNVNSHLPTGAGNSAQFTPSTGSNWQNVDDSAPDSDSTYNASGTLNQVDTFAITDLPSGTSNVSGAVVWWVARRDDAVTRGLSPVLRISGTDYVGNNQNTTLTYLHYFQAYNVSPATTSPFGVSEVNAMEAGYKVTT